MSNHLLDFPIPNVVAGMKVPLVGRGNHLVAVEDRLVVRDNVERSVARVVALKSRVVQCLEDDLKLLF